MIRVGEARIRVGSGFDAVLLDAPCTGEGLIPVDPTRKQSRQLEDLTTLAGVQQKLIVAAAALLVLGGVMNMMTGVLGGVLIAAGAISALVGLIRK